jgi:hypothetical protein
MSVDDFSYDQFVLRNAGYIQPATQEKIRNTRLLIAGCGMGSSPAMCAARLGFEKFILVDGDTVDAHNLNRQFYEFADVGKPKVEALKGQILRINPQAEVEAVQAFLDAGNTEAIVGKADIVFDTIDFVDLPAILRLHGAARARGADVFTALNVGFGALVWYFPAGGPLGLSDILAPDLADANAAHGGAASYEQAFVPGGVLFQPEQVGHGGGDVRQARPFGLLQAQPAAADVVVEDQRHRIQRVRGLGLVGTILVLRRPHRSSCRSRTFRRRCRGRR